MQIQWVGTESQTFLIFMAVSISSSNMEVSEMAKIEMPKGTVSSIFSKM